MTGKTNQFGKIENPEIFQRVWKTVENIFKTKHTCIGLRYFCEEFTYFNNVMYEKSGRWINPKIFYKNSFSSGLEKSLKRHHITKRFLFLVLESSYLTHLIEKQKNNSEKVLLATLILTLKKNDVLFDQMMDFTDKNKDALYGGDYLFETIAKNFERSVEEIIKAYSNYCEAVIDFFDDKTEKKNLKQKLFEGKDIEGEVEKQMSAFFFLDPKFDKEEVNSALNKGEKEEGSTVPEVPDIPILTPKQLGEKIRLMVLGKPQKRTGLEVSNDIDVREATISNIFKGKRPLSLKILRNLEKKYHIKLKEVFLLQANMQYELSQEEEPAFPENSQA